MLTAGWNGHAHLARGMLLYRGPVLPTSLHAHHATQIIFAPSGPLLLSDVRSTAPVRWAVIPADRPHAAVSACASAVMLYLDPDIRPYSLLACGGACLADWVQAGELLEPGLREAMEQGALPTVPSDRAARAIHPSVARLLQSVERDPGLSLTARAALLHVSPSYLRHLLRRETALSHRALVRWNRLQGAARALSRGSSVTCAAHEAGFADAAHLSRTFRATFGICPRDCAAIATWYIAPANAPL